MQQVDRHGPDPPERITCLLGGGSEPSGLIEPVQKSKTSPCQGTTHEEVRCCDSPGPAAKPGIIRFLFAPEDTTDSGLKAGWTVPIMAPRSAAGTAKAIFWMIMAILFSLMLAQLH